MCAIKLSDDLMANAGFKDEHEPTVEFACRLFDAGPIIEQLRSMHRFHFSDAAVARTLPLAGE